MAGLFERLHDELSGGAWLIGRVTGSEYAKAGVLSRTPARRIRANTGSPGATRPPRGSPSMGTARSPGDASDIGGDPIVVVLTEQVSDAHLAGLRQEASPTFSPASTRSISGWRWRS